MKFFFTLLFLALGILGLFFGVKSGRSAVEGFRAGTRAHFKAALFSFGILLLSFAQYWSLTGLFPLSLILLLIGASLASWIISTFLGAISGLAIHEKKEKIGALSAIWMFERGVRNPWLYLSLYGIFPLLLLLVSWGGSLWVFWRSPMGDPEAKVWIALFQFTLPQIIMVPILAGIWPVLTSEFLDNDLRNSNLISRFSGILYSTLWLLFPILMLKQEMQTTLGFLPPFWVLVSVPLVMFVVGGVFPHFIGMYRFRSNTASLLTWRKRWLQSLFEAIKLPVGDTRSEIVDQRLREMKQGIEQRTRSNSLIELYRGVLAEDSPLEEEVEIPADRGVDESQKALPAPAQPQTPVEAMKSLGVGTLARAYERGWPVKRRPQTTAEQALSIVTENKRRLVEWDVRFADLKEMLSLYRVSLEAKTKDLSGFLEAQMKRIDGELAELNKVTNLVPKALPSAVAALVSSVIVGLLKAYNEEIVKLVTGLLYGST